MSLYQLQKLIYHVNRDPAQRERYRQDPAAFVKNYDLTDDESQAALDVDVRALYTHGRPLAAAAAVHLAAQSLQRRLRQSTERIGVSHADRICGRRQPCARE